MKVSQGKKKFVPVTITLESQEEVDAFYAMIGNTAEGDSGVNLVPLYADLSTYVSDVDAPTIQAEPGWGTVMLKKA